MENRAAYAAVMALNDESLELHNRIDSELTDDQVKSLSASLCIFAGKLEEALAKHNALSEERKTNLAEVFLECDQAKHGVAPLKPDTGLVASEHG